MAKSITCPVCGMTSYNPNDVEHKYCGNCHAFHRDLLFPPSADDVPFASPEAAKEYMRKLLGG